MPISTFEHPRTAMYHTGIGGVGNYRRISYKELEPSPKAIEVFPRVPRPFFGGRGGFGNSHFASERAIFAFDEELARERLAREHAAPIYSIGRGGVGNYVSSNHVDEDNQYGKSVEDHMPPFLRSTPRRTSTTSRSSSASSISINADKLFQKLKNYKK